MKKFIVSLSAGILLLAACNTKEEAGMSEKARKNLDAMHGVSKAIETKDLSKLSDYMAEDVVDHAAQNGPAKGIENVKADLQKSMDAVSDMKWTVIKELADDDYVMCWMKFSGIMNADMMGMKKGERIESSSLEVARFNNDSKVVEHWTLMEPSVMMKMMGGEQTPAVDTSKKAATDTIK